MKKLLLFAAILLPLSGLLAQGDCFPQWMYYREITITNTTGGMIANYQVALEVNTADLIGEGKLQPGADDLRVVDTNCNPVDFYLEKPATEADNRIWVRVDALANGAALDLWVFYGNLNTSGSLSDGESVFLFFDDFSDPDVDLTKWEPVGEYDSLAIEDGQLVYASTSQIPGPRFKFVRTLAGFSEPVFWDLRATINSNASFGFCDSDTLTNRTLFRYISGAADQDTLAYLAFMQDTFDNGYVYDLEYPNISVEQYVPQELSVATRVTPEGKMSYVYFGNSSNGQFSLDQVVLEPFYSPQIHLILSGFGPTNLVYLDEIRVRKATPSLPTTEIGAEIELDPSASTEQASNASFEIWPNPTDGMLHFNLPDSWTASQIRILDALGREVYRGDFTPAILLPEQAKGLLCVLITDKNSAQTYGAWVLRSPR